jgi:hypothetical protein
MLLTRGDSREFRPVKSLLFVEFQFSCIAWIVLNQWSFWSNKSEVYNDTSYYWIADTSLKSIHWFPRFRGIVVGRCLPSYITESNRKQNIRRKMSWISDDEPSTGRSPSILYYPPDRLSSVMMHLPAPAYGVYLSQLIRYSRACGSYKDFLDRGFLLTRKLMKQGFLLVKLKSSLRTFYGRHPAMVDRYGISVSQMTMDMFRLS